MYSLVPELSATRVVVGVDVISLRVRRCRIAPEDLFQIFTKRFCSLGTVSKIPEELFILCESLLPGTVLGPADPQSWALPFSPSVWTYSSMCTWSLGLKPSCFPSNHCSCWHPAPTKPIPWLLCHFLHFCISNGMAASSLQSQPQTLDVPSVPQAIIEVSPTGHWVGQLVSHTAPSRDSEVPVSVMSTLQSK